MKKVILVFALGILAHPLWSQNTGKETLTDALKSSELAIPAISLHLSSSFHYTPPWLRLETARELSLNTPEYVRETASQRIPATTPQFGILNSSRRVIYPYFGGFFQIKSEVVYSPSDRLTFTIGGTLVRLDTPDELHPQMQYGIHSSVAWSFTNWLSLRLYGQRLWHLGQEPPSPYLFLNPRFPQTGVGAALSSQFKNVQMDMGPKAIFEPQSKSPQKLNLINTKIKIRF